MVVVHFCLFCVCAYHFRGKVVAAAAVLDDDGDDNGSCCSIYLFICLGFL